MSTVKELVKKPVVANGTPQKTAVSPLAVSLAPAVTPKNESQKVETLEDKFHRLNILFDLQKKHGKCVEATRELTAFTIAQNKENSLLELSDDDGNEFSTKNPVIIAEVVKMVLAKLKEKTAELEAQIVL